MSKYKKQQNLQEVATVLGSGAVYLAKLVAGELVYDTAMEAFVGDAFAATADGTTTGRFKQEMINAYEEVAAWYNINVPKGPYQAKKEKITIIPGIEWVRTKDPITKFLYGDGPDELDEQINEQLGVATSNRPNTPSFISQQNATATARKMRKMAKKKAPGGEWRRKSVNWLFKLDKIGYDKNSQMVVTGTAEEPIWVLGDWQRRVADRDETPGGNMQLRKYNQIRRKLKKTSAKAKTQLKKLQQENPQMYQSFLDQLKKEQASMKDLEIQDLVKQIEQENLLDENEMLESFKNFSFKKEEPVQQAPVQRKPQKTSIRKTPVSTQKIRKAQSGEEVGQAAAGLFESKGPQRIDEIIPLLAAAGGAIGYLASCIAWEAIDPAVAADATMDGSWARTILRGYDNMEAWYNKNVPYGPTQAKRDGTYVMPGIEWIPEKMLNDGYLDKRNDVDEQDEVNSMKGAIAHAPLAKVQEQAFTGDSGYGSTTSLYRTAKKIDKTPEQRRWSRYGGQWVRQEGYLLKSVDRQQYDKNSQVVLVWSKKDPNKALWVLGDLHRRLIDGDGEPGGDPKKRGRGKKRLEQLRQAREKAQLAKKELAKIRSEDPEKYGQVLAAIEKRKREFIKPNSPISSNPVHALKIAKQEGLLGSKQKVIDASNEIRKLKPTKQGASQATADSIKSSATDADTATAAAGLFEEYFSQNKKILRKIENNNLIKIIQEELDNFLSS